jgi:tetratricopeptide (TPR) repeat protein
VKRIALLATLALAGCKKEDAPLHLERAHAALFAQKPDVALAEYKLTLDLVERDPSAQANLYRARALRGAADLYGFELNDPRRAVDVYRELITVCPEAPETLEGRLHLAGLLWHQFRDLRGAIAEYTAALARNPPQSAELSFTVAKLYFELQDYGQCELEAGKVVQKYETSAWVDDALYLRGQALSMDGRKPDAMRVFNDLLERFPDSELRSHSLVELGRLKADAGEPEKAIELWIEALKTHPTPGAVQQQIALVRGRLRATTPTRFGDATAAFDWDKYPVFEKGGEGAAAPVAARPLPKTSAEAVGGTAEEAQREAKMPAERSEPTKP